MRFFIICLLSFVINCAFSQIYNRVECDISIKEVNCNGSQHLMMGKVYFDRNVREIIYVIDFPNPMRFAITDYGMVNDTTSIEFSTTYSTHLIDFSIFNLILNGQLNYFGLDKTSYQLTDATKSGDQVISEWTLPEEMGSAYGKMMISQKDKLLHAMVSLDADERIVSKQFFKDYTQVKDLDFPCQLIQMSYAEGEVVSKKITTFRNIILNSQNASLYHYR